MMNVWMINFNSHNCIIICLEIIMIANTFFASTCTTSKRCILLKTNMNIVAKRTCQNIFLSYNNEGIMDLVFALLSMFKFWTLINLIWLVSLHLGFSAMHKTGGCHIWYIYILVFTGHILQIVFTDETAMYNYLSLSYLQTNAWHHRIAVNPGPFFSWMIAVYSLFI